MVFSAFSVGLVPTFGSIGWGAPVLLVTLRLLQGLALGGEYGGAATYVAEHAPQNQRGYDTSWIQTTATLGFFLALLVIYLCRFTGWIEAKDFAAWGWRIPFLVSLILLIFSIYIRPKLNESPLFKALTHYVNPALEAYQTATPISVAANPKNCEFHIFVGPWSTFSDCDKAQDLLTKSGLSFTTVDLPAGSTDTVVTKIGNTEL